MAVKLSNDGIIFQLFWKCSGLSGIFFNETKKCHVVGKKYCVDTFMAGRINSI
jgi:hypothetical protein